MKKNYVIGISCIGSGVGQSVINSCRISRLPIKTIGLGTNPFAFGAYDCDCFDYTPTIYADNYVDELLSTCKRNHVDLLIPGLDDEVLIYAQNMGKFHAAGIKAIVAGEQFVKLCRDKERMILDLSQVADVFVKSYDKKTLQEDIAMGKIKFPLIAKPRSGFASRGIEIIKNEQDMYRIGDEYVIQELAIPARQDPNHDFYLEQISKNRNPQVSEISIQLVVDPDGHLMGRMASYNKLNNGVPIEIVPFENDLVWEVIGKLMPAFLKLGLRGPLNIQGRITEHGLKLFEMNPRFTGITGLRALMGFNEVEACVKEWLGIDKGKNFLQFNYNRFGMRQTADKSVPVERNERVTKLIKQINPNVTKKQKKILVTGASGYLGQSFINKLYETRGYEIIIFGRDKEKTTNLFKGKVSNCFDKKDLDCGLLQLGNVDILIHLSFARPHCNNMQIAESLEFTHELFTRAAMNQVPAIINISSQSVYGLETPPPWNEETPVAPAIIYAQAKYATELHLKSLKKINNQLMYSSIRLGALAGGAAGFIEVCFLSKIVKQALQGEPIKIVGGSQEMERIDVRDAAAGLVAMLQIDPGNWKPVYNLGSGAVYNILKIARMVVEITSGFNKNVKSKIYVEEKPVNMRFGMDSSLFYDDMKWRPQYNLRDTIISLAEYLKERYE
jgi:nucleoside-diphosphate-sugar epimerase